MWPRLVHEAARRRLGPAVVGERLVAYGGAEQALDAVVRARPDAIVVSLIGSDLVQFNRAYPASGLGAARLCAALEEHGLLGVGGDGTGELYASMGYFGCLTTDAGLDFGERYTRRFGVDAPMLNAHGQGCYEAVRMLAALATRARTLAVPRLEAVADGTSITSARGRLTLYGGHVRQRVHLGRADGLDFDVITSD